MKKFLAFILALIMIATLFVACDSGSSKDPQSTPDSKPQNNEVNVGKNEGQNNESGDKNESVDTNKEDVTDNAGPCHHVDDNADHACDKCDAYMGAHVDSFDDGDHKCDYCGETIGICVDRDPRDHFCDECGGNVGEHSDSEDSDHLCDYCNELITDCTDDDKNHRCDECGQSVGIHADATDDGDHLCDHCSEKMTYCDDANRDHSCDECKTAMGEHKDIENDSNHNCEYCGEKIGDCIDTDKNHICDECQANVGSHSDDDKDHSCDYCKEIMSVCTDSDKNLLCDICGAAYYSKGLEYEKNSDGTGYIVKSKGTCPDVDVVIPGTHEGLPVVAIGDYARLNAYSITIPDSVTSIGSYAFADLSSRLLSITIGKNVSSIGDKAFDSCKKLVEIVNNSSITLTLGDVNGNEYQDAQEHGFYALDVHTGTSKIVNKNGYLFYTYTGVNYLIGYAENGKTLVLPESYNGQSYDIYKNTFSGNYSITSVVIEGNIKNIGESAFNGCTGMKSVTVGQGVENIGDYAFSSCWSLESVLIADSVAEINERAFYGCLDLKHITLPESIMYIGASAFSGNLQSVSYEGSIASWCSISFEERGNPMEYTEEFYVKNSLGEYELLKELVIPDTVTEIKPYAFYACKTLTSVKVGSGVTNIGEYAFYGNVSLESIVIDGNATNIGEGAFKSCGISTVVINGGSIGEMAFENCSDLVSITLGENVTDIGYNAFENCYKLVEIINLSALEIGKGDLNKDGDQDLTEHAFYTLEIHNGVSKIVKQGDYLFYTVDGVNYLVNYTGSTKRIALPEDYNGSNYVINARAFYYNDVIETVEIPASVDIIDKYAFYGCSSLWKVESEAKVIGESAFEYCTYLTDLTIYGVYGGGDRTIGKKAFYNCYRLEAFELNHSVKSIGDSAFYGCSSLESLSISAKTIGDRAFYGCSGLESLSISAQTIGDSAFYGCSGLESVTMYSIQTIGDNAFTNCSSLKQVWIPYTATSIGKCAFLNCQNLNEVYFESTTKWSCILESPIIVTPISSSELSDPAMAAKYLRDTYYNCYWGRSTT